MTPDKVEAALVRALCDADGGRSPPASYERMAKAALATLTSALAESERDAARYRWLRENPEHESIPYFDDGKWIAPYLVDNAGGLGGGVGQKSYDSLDAAIDAAMKDTDHAH